MSVIIWSLFISVSISFFTSYFYFVSQSHSLLQIYLLILKFEVFFFHLGLTVMYFSDRIPYPIPLNTSLTFRSQPVLCPLRSYPYINLFYISILISYNNYAIIIRMSSILIFECFLKVSTS